jgi:hypothetical protein
MKSNLTAINTVAIRLRTLASAFENTGNEFMAGVLREQSFVLDRAVVELQPPREEINEAMFKPAILDGSYIYDWGQMLSMIDDHIAQDEKINAIRIVYRCCNVRLKEAKDWVEARMSGNKMEDL